MRRWSVHLSSRLRRPAGFVVALAIVLGAAPRVATWLAAPSFWLDEAMLALNVVSRPLRHLLQPLEYGQTGAPLFLMLSRLAAAAAGATELALRALPLVTGLLLLWLVWRLGPASGPSIRFRIEATWKLMPTRSPAASRLAFRSRQSALADRSV